MMKRVTIRLSESSMRELYDLRQKYKFPDDKEQSWEDFKKECEEKNIEGIACLFG